MAIRYAEHEVRAGLRNRRALTAFLQELIRRHRSQVQAISLQFVFCTDDYLLNINRQFLDHDTYTDIVTFDLCPEDPSRLEGEIYISTERVMENAGKFGAEYLRELHRVIFHGVLHLCGFGDKTPAQKKEMSQREDECLAAYLTN